MAIQTKYALSKLYRKIFCPNGIILDDVREYCAGDDTRFINWNVTAKMNSPFVDNIRADSGNDIIFALDISESIKYGTQKQSKGNLATDIIAEISNLAAENNDKSGLVLFSNTVEKYLPPKRSTEAIAYAIKSALDVKNHKKTDLLCVLKFLNKVIRKRSVILLFCDTFALAQSRKLVLSQLHILKSKHEVLLFDMMDDNDVLKSGLGVITIEDAETGDAFEIDTNDLNLMSKIQSKFFEYQSIILKDINKIGIKTFAINTNNSSISCVFDIFRKAQKQAIID